MPPAERAAHMLALEREQEERGNRSSSSASSHRSTTVDKNGSASSSDSYDSSNTDDEERPKNPVHTNPFPDKPGLSEPSDDSDSESSSSPSGDEDRPEGLPRPGFGQKGQKGHFLAEGAEDLTGPEDLIATHPS